MESPEKELSSKTNIGIFYLSVALILQLDCFKDIRF